MKATVIGLLALLMLASPFAAMAAAQEDEIVIERDLQVRVTTGSTDRFGGGDWIRIDVGSTTFAVLYGNESHPNSPKIVAEYDRYLGAAEVYNEEGELIHGLTPLPVRTIMVQSFDFMVEFRDANHDGFDLRPSFEEIITENVDYPRKILSLRQTWALEDLVIREGDRLTEVDFNITARDLDYTLVRPTDVPGDGLDRITFSYHIDVKLEETTLDVPVYNLTVSQDRGIVALEKRTETVTGLTVNGTFKYDHYIEGWDWGADDSRLALVTHVFAGNFIPAPVAKFLHLEFALRALENDTEHSEDTIGDRPLLIEADSMTFEDEWKRIGRIYWVSDVTVDDQPMQMFFQLFRAERVSHRGLQGLFMGVRFGGAFVYPQGNVIFHDPGLDASVFVPQGQVITPGGAFLGLAPYFIQLGVVTVAIVGLIAYQVLRREPQA